MNDELLSKVMGLLKSRSLTVATAESCTGGLLSKHLTELAGSSEIFMGGVVAYSNRCKIDVLGVDEVVINQYGAVSAECAEQMARRTRELMHADIGIALTGVAGPGGGSQAKPVGTVWLGIDTKAGGSKAALLNLQGSRSEVRQEAALRALVTICDIAEGKEEGL